MATSVEKYSLWQRIIHWLTLLLLLVSFFSHEAMQATFEALEHGGTASPTTGTAVHVWIGVTILVLTLARIVLRIRFGAPAPVAGQSRGVTVAAAIVHGLIYVLLLALPLSGMAAWFGGVEDAAEFHEPLFLTLLILVIGHVGAALYHQFVTKDNLIARMR